MTNASQDLPNESIPRIPNIADAGTILVNQDLESFPIKKRGRPKKKELTKERAGEGLEKVLIDEPYQDSNIDTRPLKERAYQKAMELGFYHEAVPVCRAMTAYIEVGSFQMQTFPAPYDATYVSSLFRYLTSKQQILFWGQPEQGDLVFCEENGKINSCYIIDRFLPHEKKLFVIDNESPNIIECKRWYAFGQVKE